MGLKHVTSGMPAAASLPRPRLQRRWRPLGKTGRTTRWARAACLVLLALAVPPARAEAPPTPDAASSLPSTLPAELPESVAGKLDWAEKQAKADKLAEAAGAIVQAVRQAVVEARKTDPPDRDAMEVYENALQALVRLADHALEAGKLGVARHCYTQARGMNPRLSQTVYGLAEVARLAGQPLEAFQLYGDYLKMDRPLDHRGDLGMGLACLALGKPSLARWHLEKAVRVAPNNAEAKMGLARALHDSYSYKEAMPYAEQAIALDDAAPPEERHLEYRYWFALILNKAKQPDRAIAVSRKLTDSVRSRIKEDPTNLELIDGLDRALALQYELVSAQTKTNRGGRDPRVYMEMAQLIEARGAIQQIRVSRRALAALMKAREIDPQNVNLLLRIGEVQRMVGDRDGSIETYQTVLNKAPGNEVAKQALRDMGAPLKPPTTTSTASSAEK